ncbi:glycosyltransferase family 2 protein [Brevibacillus dissolubilis]|uniref:glycosyltransferase family 2 protein n=1 Tax=Brevibacillus dissolubilis TaxID=1844116 RepID=UPI001C3F3B43|nr:glycosyltransferase family 2 protein [Brevibacillus dissolubilis]
MAKVAVIFSTYNSASYVEECLRSCLEQNDQDLVVIVADDGSTDNTIQVMQQAAQGYTNFHLIPLPHGERGIARATAIALAKELAAEYLYVIDSDMVMQPNLIRDCLSYFAENPSVGALIIPEKAYTTYDNYFSHVKVFERNIINNGGEEVGLNSIEAARFWRVSEYEKSGGISEKQIAFEETQPTIRYLELGGVIKRATFTGVLHNEKYVTLKNILEKKRYYFSVMDKTLNEEKQGFTKALSRWYFFRSVLYRPSNLVEYVKHPLLTGGMFFMYVALTSVGVFELGKSILNKR